MYEISIRTHDKSTNFPIWISLIPNTYELLRIIFPLNYFLKIRIFKHTLSAYSRSACRSALLNIHPDTSAQQTQNKIKNYCLWAKTPKLYSTKPNNKKKCFQNPIVPLPFSTHRRRHTNNHRCRACRPKPSEPTQPSLRENVPISPQKCFEAML